MTFWTLIRRSLRFHARAHVGVVLGAAIGSAALIGALVVGDSVRGSLRQRALDRIGEVQYLLEGRDRLFTDSTNTWTGAFGDSYVLGLHVPAIASARQSAARANQVNLYGVQSDFWEFSEAETDIHIETNSVLLNQPLAAQLGVSAGDTVLLRFRKPSLFSSEEPLSPQARNSVALQLKVQGVLTTAQFGGFSPVAGMTPVRNAFMRLDQLQEAAGLDGRANLVLNAGITANLPRPFYAIRRRLCDWIDELGFDPPNWLSPKSVRDLSPEAGPDGLNFDLQDHWSVADAGLVYEILEQQRAVELRSRRVFFHLPTMRQVPRGNELLLPLPRLGMPSSKDMWIVTYLANLLQAGTNVTPYSMVTAAGPPYTPADMRDDEILVTDWLADDLRVNPGDWIEMASFAPESGAKLVESTNRVRVRGIVPLSGIYADRTLMPDFPGIENAGSTRDWDAGFAVDLKRIRPKDEAYWKDHRGTPKAFVTLATGQRMWGNRFGDVTAIRFPAPAGVSLEDFKRTLETNFLRLVSPSEMGLRFEPVRAQSLKAADQAQDFGQLFLGFSIFLVVAALLLMALLFQFGLEQRAAEVGTLLALGFTPKQVRRLFLSEGAMLALAGSALGVLGGVAYAKAMLWGLATVWRGAVGPSTLQFHATPATLVIGVFAGTVVALLTIWLTLRKQARQPARELLGGEVQGPRSKVQSRGAWVAVGSGLAAAAIVIWALVQGESANAGAFFGAGALLLVAGLGWAAAWFGRLAREAGATRLTLGGLGVRGCARRRKRSLATVALLACGCFLIVAIGVFRLDANRDATARNSGTGGFALIGEATMPVVQDLNTRSGREFFGLGAEELAGVNAVPLRVRAGDEASCLNLNRAQKPRLLGVKPELLAGRFTFANVAKGLDRRSGWELLDSSSRRQEALTGESPIANRQSQIDQSPLAAALTNNSALRTPSTLRSPPSAVLSALRSVATEDGLRRTGAATEDGHSALADEVPAIGDANSIQWALGKKVGDTLDYVDEQGRAFKLRLVGAVANSILQGSLLIDEAEFVKRFPGESGYRMFLLDAPSNAVPQVSATLSRVLQDVGLELTPAAERLNAFNAVQNTYLGTFQILGGLGLLLGSAGLGIVVLRNVLERRGELGLLVAVGFRRSALQRLVLSEHGALLGLGLGIGIAAAAVAVLPAIVSPGTQLPYGSLALTLAAVLLNGLLWTWLATGHALRGNLLEALRNE
jgi:ABC-type antimicrobial peptide transport system permease subunit